MPNATLELVDTSIVVVPSGPLPKISDLATQVEANASELRLRLPINITQGIVVSPLGGPVTSYQIESMRSRKTVGISSLRVEAHDVSGETNVGANDLPHTVSKVAELVKIDGIKAYGTNFELTFMPHAGKPAAAEIADKMLSDVRNLLPSGIDFVGGSTRLFLRKDETACIVAMEPRANDPASPILWVSLNAECQATDMPSLDQLIAFYESSYETLRGVVESAFPGTFR